MTRLQSTEIKALRAAAPPLPLIPAPPVSSDEYKSPYNRTKPPAKHLDHHFSLESRNFTGSALKKGSSPSGPRKIIPLGTGRPTADYYPWESISLNEASPEPTSKSTTKPNLQSPKEQEKCHSANTITKHGLTYNLSIAMNYGFAHGSAHLLRFITEHVELIHNPPYTDWATFLSCGATAATELAFRIFCNRGDTILAEQYTYPGTLESAALNGINVHGIEMDADGLRADALDEVLSSWDDAQSPRPHVLYTIPTGQNPTGVTQSLERRRAIYDIAEEHDLIIIEDDPYYFLRMGPYQDTQGTNGTDTNQSASEDDEAAQIYHSESIPSYLTLDTSGRVVRLDSASKILAPGLRAGWVTASKQIIDKFTAYQEVSTVAVSGPSQLMLWHLLDENWGHDGFTTWLVHLSREYRWRRDVLLDACNKYLPREAVQWNTPEFGMFLWVKVDWTRHHRLKSLSGLSLEEVGAQIIGLEERVAARALEKGVLVTKGSLFASNQERNGHLHFRMTFAAAEEGDLKEGVRLFAEAVCEEFDLGI
ncbi:aminotransferase-like domain-containing protein [Aspergillus luchuensis]|uniref:Aromatic aminotransferase Aro8 n=1 Tax=Aspergillus kawachii TaxID=1069201 RepID=A0A146FXH3_ASPKA|nr:aromatic/aminoadipate aminotransferase 1 [Aspergillus luchuensis]BCS02181.1 aromatic/aminoadipate aminotransferase 1 [Aspergillus luchuensis]BCS13867.1 aromatic/aminoadipate aminotransferase 1 [Aspergillus luchuensis]GAA90543.1 aromatic aminotransferase Aro8 [Aspergillus luchuensis IFO 4308]GAT29543.1 aromatic aminotransferase Aro8 [Aspergillus luchuensis]